MKVEKVVVGSLEENCYILEVDNKVLVVDPGDEYDKIINKINGREILGILITHSHFDHVGALNEFNVIDVYSFNNLKERDYTIGPFKFNVIFNPGHSCDSVSYYFYKDNLLFCGDFVFYHNIGRCDLPTGNMGEMINSIEKIKKLLSNTILYPGHGSETTIMEEIENNYYFNTKH